MSDSDADLGDRLEALFTEVRRQGRAAIAAQAAAEECLAVVSREEPRDDAWLRALLPVFDSVDRLATAHDPSKLSWWRRSLARDDLPEGLRILRGQLQAALVDVGVEVIHPLGERFDATRHRAAEVRRGKASEVLEVLRPGYAYQGRVIREADVAVGKETSS